jgi:hypothetical protein
MLGARSKAVLRLSLQIAGPEDKIDGRRGLKFARSYVSR